MPLVCVVVQKPPMKAMKAMKCNDGKKGGKKGDKKGGKKMDSSERRWQRYLRYEGSAE